MTWHTFHRRDLPFKGRRPTRKRPAAVIGLLSLLVFTGMAVAGFAWAKKDIVVVDGKKTQSVSSFKRTVGDLLLAVETELGPYDQVDPGLDTTLEDGMQITIARAVPVTIRIDGDERLEMSTAETVGELLSELDIVPGPNYLVTPDPSAPIDSDLSVAVVRVSEKTIDEEVELPFGETRREAYNLEKGKASVYSEGVPGLEKRSWKVVYHDGVEASRELIQSETIRKPKDKVVLVGMADTVSRGGRDLHFSRAIEARATAYTYTGRNTATGKPPGPGTVAVDPAVIPLGSKLYIDGYGYGTAMDKGRAIKGNRVDVFFPSRTQALKWGSRNVNVYVLR